MNGTNNIEQMRQVMASTPGFDIVYDRGANVLDNDEKRKFESVSGISFPVIRREHWERALNLAHQDHEREESIQQDVHGENQNTFEHVKVKVPPKPFEPTREERQSHEATIVRFVHGVRSASRPRHAKQVVNPEHIPVIEFEYVVRNTHAW